MSSVFEFTVNDIAGKPVSLSEYQGKVLLIANTASRCVYTPQYEGLQALYEKYRDKGLVVLGFPCDQFGHQEPGSNDEVAAFCSSKFSVGFPLFQKIDVNGEGAEPLFKHLTSAAPGLLGTRKIKWNFTKFLVSRDGKSIERYAPNTAPKALAADIERLL